MYQLHLWEKERIRGVRLNSKHPDWIPFLKEVSDLFDGGEECGQDFHLTQRVLRRKKYLAIDKIKTLNFITHDLDITCDCNLQDYYKGLLRRRNA